MALNHTQEVAMNTLYRAALFAAAAALSFGGAAAPAYAQAPDSHHDHGPPSSGHDHGSPHSEHDHSHSGPGGYHDGRHDGDHRRHDHDRSSVRLGINLGYWWGYPYYYRPYYRPYRYYDPYYYRPYPYEFYPAPTYRYYQYAPPPTRTVERPYPCLQEREYQTTVIIGGREVEAYGTACLQPDGSWRRGPATVVPPD
jgi:hypothetical protein